MAVQLPHREHWLDEANDLAAQRDAVHARLQQVEYGIRQSLRQGVEPGPDVRNEQDILRRAVGDLQSRIDNLRQYSATDKGVDLGRSVAKGLLHGVGSNNEQALRGLFDLAQVGPNILAAPYSWMADLLSGSKHPDKSLGDYYGDAVLSTPPEDMLSRENFLRPKINEIEALEAKRPDSGFSRSGEFFGEGVAGLGQTAALARGTAAAARAAGNPRVAGQVLNSPIGRYAVEATNSLDDLGRAVLTTEIPSAVGAAAGQSIGETAGGPVGGVIGTFAGGMAGPAAVGGLNSAGRTALTDSGFDSRRAANVRQAAEDTSRVWGHPIPYSPGMAMDNGLATLEASAMENPAGRLVAHVADIGQAQNINAARVVDDIATSQLPPGAPATRQGGAAVGRELRDQLASAETALHRNLEGMSNRRAALAGGRQAVVPIRSFVNRSRQVVDRDLRGTSAQDAVTGQVRRAIDDSIGSTPSAERLRQFIATTRQRAAGLPDGRARAGLERMADAAEDALIQGGRIGLPYASADNLRREIGGKTASGAQVPAKAARVMYRGLSEDVRTAVMTHSGQAGLDELAMIKQVERRILNDSKSRTRLPLAEGGDRAQLEKLLNRADSGTLYAWVMGDDLSNPDMLGRLTFLQRALERDTRNPGAWDEMRATILANLGASNPRNVTTSAGVGVEFDFSPVQFRTRWNKLGPEAQAMVAGSQELAGLMDETIIPVIESLAYRNQRGNASRSGTHLQAAEAVNTLSGSNSLGKDGVLRAVNKGMVKLMMRLMAYAGLLNSRWARDMSTGALPSTSERVLRRTGPLYSQAAGAASDSAAEQQYQDGRQ